MTTYTVYISGRRIQTETTIEATSSFNARQRFAAQHGVKTFWVVALRQPRPRRPVLQNNHFWQKTEDQLRYIIADASAAAEAMRGHDPVAENKYLDQVNDAATVLQFKPGRVS